MVQLLWRTMAGLSVSGPAGWSPVEYVEVHHHSGDAFVRVETWPVAGDTVLDQIAEAHGRRMLPDHVEELESLSSTDMLGSDGLRRTVAWTDTQGRDREATLLYALVRRRAVAVTQVVPSLVPSLRAEAEEIVGSMTVRDPLDLPDEVLPLRPGTGVDLSGVEQAWIEGRAHQAALPHVITVEETFAAARHFGVAMLPGADVGRWEALTPPERDLVAAVSWGSLEARHVSGETTLREGLELAASHDLVVVLTAGEDDDSRVEWFAARQDRMTRLRPLAGGHVQMSVHDTAELADLVLADVRGIRGSASAVRRRDGAVVGRESAWPATATDEEVRGALASLLALSDRSGATP